MENTESKDINMDNVTQISFKEVVVKEGTNMVEDLYKTVIIELENENKELKNQLSTARDIIIEENKEKQKLMEEFLEIVDSEMKILDNYSSLLKKYDALSQSKLGKLTRFIWKIRRKIKLVSRV